MRAAFDEQLDFLRGKLVTMAATATSAIHWASESLFAADLAGARRTLDTGWSLPAATTMILSSRGRGHAWLRDKGCDRDGTAVVTMTAERKASQRVPTRQRRLGEIRAKRVYAQRMADQRVIAARRSHRHRMWRKSAGIGLTVLAAAVALSHLLDHQNAFHLMSQQVLEDILVGYPTAFGLLIVAAIVAWPKVSH